MPDRSSVSRAGSSAPKPPPVGAAFGPSRPLASESVAIRQTPRGKMGSACAPHHANAHRSADVGTCVPTPRGAVVGRATSVIDRRRRRWVLPAVSRARGSGTVAVAGKSAGGPHAGSAMDRAGATDSCGGGEGDGVRGVAYGVISPSGYCVCGGSTGGVKGAMDGTFLTYVHGTLGDRRAQKERRVNKGLACGQGDPMLKGLVIL